MGMTTVIYHGGCWDGFCAAWVARKWLGTEAVDFVPSYYGQQPPNIDECAVYVLDFSYPRDVLVKMRERAASLLVLDHHATAKEALAGLDFCQFGEDISGARMTWEHFYGNGNMLCPWLVDYTEDRDLWRHRLPNSEAVNAALRSYPLDFDLWDDDLQWRRPSELVPEGEAIRRREKQIVADHVKQARRQKFDSWTVPVVNATVLFSEIAGELAKGEPFGACYFDRQDGKRQWSLRSSPDGIDVSQVAKAHSGGGHKHAAGFEQVVS